MKQQKNVVWIMFFGWVTILFLLIALSSKAQHPNYYLEQFKEDAKLYNVQLSYSDPLFILQEQEIYITLNGVYTQVEAYSDYTTSVIYFDVTSKMWTTNRKVLVYHELGHHYLRRVHTDKNSIMNINIWSTKYFDHLNSKTQQEYVRELFLY